ncbi:MAG: hypothetical protein JNK00_05180 [Flavipsychrobacter sp.]|nr:hypothetical protein [Flavipsychrobacter sp.]
MKKRSPSFPSKTIPIAKGFSVTIFESVGETVLSYADLAKKGSVALREADNFAISSSQYGFMKIERGKGYGAIGKVCSALRLPKDGEESALYLSAFTSPPIYKTLISLFNGKKITEQGLIIDLVRDHEFTDNGAELASRVFIENARFLGLINEDGVLNVDAEIKIEPLPIKGSKPKTPTKLNDKRGATGKSQIKPENTTKPGVSNYEVGTSVIKKISIFVRGQELHFPVLESMTLSDWDAIIKQLQNIKAFSK